MSWFYLSLQSFDAALLVLGAVLNFSNRRMLLLTVAVGVGVLFPIYPVEIPVFWYAQCMLVELIVSAIAWFIKAGEASKFVAFVTFVLAGTHLTGMIVGPSEGVGLYRMIVPVFEISQLLTCILMSSPFVTFLRVVKYPERT